ncbi:carbohydrate binding [Desmophyllum pertusum]|uniref:Carbohydrate binding n=1 Tax=Desmophyllum pertusum TaxID=174260 RepID=A0A9W9ZHN9_9CNID|nr:carbohydrate binding [Desmophyllum pertusum]
MILCSSGWTRFDDYCYLVSGSIKTWLQAREYCHGLSGDLVKINSADENEFVLNLVRKQAPKTETSLDRTAMEFNRQPVLLD